MASDQSRIPKSLTRSQLQKLRSGTDVRKLRPVLNAIIEFVNSSERPPGVNTRSDSSGTVIREHRHSLDELSWVRCESLDAAPAYSILEVYDGEMDAQGLIVKVRSALDGVSSDFEYAGNEDYELEAGGTGWVKLINPYHPVLVQADGNVTFLEDVTIEGLKVKAHDEETGLATLAPQEIDNIPLGMTGRTPVISFEKAGGGSEIIRFTIDSMDEYDECASAQATVDEVACELSTPSPGETITVYDGLGCFFNVPPNDLMGLKGYAAKMEGSYECRWEVISLCCSGE